MNKMIRIYSCNETDFSSNGLAILDEAKDVCITHELNGSYNLQFEYPIDSAKWEFIANNRICRVGDECFRIRSIDNNKIYALALYMDAQFKHIQYIGDMLGKTPRYIMTQLFKNTNIHIMTDAEVKSLGMEWVNTATDFFEASKITPIVGVSTLSETLEKQSTMCELYVDNYNLALVKQIGKDNGNELTLRFNAKSAESSRDASTLITRLYPYGQDDLDISTVNNGKQYIDSPMVEKIGVYEGFSNFDECEEPDELLKLAKWQFSEDNLERIDIPKYTMTVGYVDVCEAYKYHNLNSPSIGDRVKIFDKSMNTKTLQRIITTKIYPFEPRKSTIEVGHPQVTIDSFFKDIATTNIIQKIQRNGKKEIKTSYLEMMRENVKVSINEALQNENIAKYQTGALFESPDGQSAVAIIKGQLAIAGQKTEGEWDWTTVINDNEIIVSDVFTGALYTNLCTIMSANGKLTIENSLITMQDENNIVRFECGYKNGKYVFCLYDATGEQNVYINSSGEAVFAGSINTKKDTTVGSRLNLQTTENAGEPQEPAINFINSKGVTVARLACSDEGIVRMVPIGNNSVFKIAEYKIATERDIKNLQDQINQIKNDK
jgi:phage minor structural protein